MGYIKKNMVTESIFQYSVINEAVTIILNAAKCKGLPENTPKNLVHDMMAMPLWTWQLPQN